MGVWRVMFEINNKLIEELWDNKRSIAYFINKSSSYWVLDFTSHYRLDIEYEAKALLKKGHITSEIFNRGLKTARGGIPQLNGDTFEDYLALEETIILKTTDLNEILCYGFSKQKLESIYTCLERYLSQDGDIDDEFFYEVNRIRSRLPRYYINFDRKFYLHTDYDLCPEGAVTYDNWVATEGDFSYRIPDKDTYWILENKNFWKTMYF